VKGRRRARRMALQVLYEVDQSDHALERVLAWRIWMLMVQHLARALPGVPSEERAAVADLLRARLVVAPPEALDALAFDTAQRAAFAEALSSAAGEPALAGLMARALDEADLAEMIGQLAHGLRMSRGVRENLGEIDAVIAEIAPEWPVEQMAPVDRNILRIALWEIGMGSAPVRVAINEAVELAREFSGESARRMVNGALGTYASSETRIALEQPDA